MVRPIIGAAVVALMACSKPSGSTSAASTGASPSAVAVAASGAAKDAPYEISGLTAETPKLDGQKWILAKFKVTAKQKPTATNMQISVKFTCVIGPTETAEFDVPANVPDLYGKLSPMGFDAIGQTVDGQVSTRAAHTFERDPLECTLGFSSGESPKMVALGEVCIDADGTMKAGPCGITAARRQ